MQRLVILVAATAVALTGCSSSKKATATSTTPTSASASPTPSTLSKADVVTQANAVCDKYAKQIAALPTPTGPTDYTNIRANLEGTLAVGETFFPELTVIFERSADKTALHENWLDLSKADYETGKAIVQQALDAIAAKDNTKVQAALTALDGLPDHSKAFSTYLTAYGLDSCSKFETG